MAHVMAFSKRAVVGLGSIIASVVVILLLVSGEFPLASSVISGPTGISNAPPQDPLPQPCAYYIFFSSSSKTYEAINCSTYIAAFGGPKNLGGASGKSAFSVIQDALNTGTKGDFELGASRFNVSGTISLGIAQNLVGQNPNATQLIEITSSTVLVSVKAGASYAGLESVTLQGVNGADVLQILGNTLTCPRYQTFSDVFVQLAKGNIGTSSQWLVHIFCSYESTLQFFLGNPGLTLNANYFKWQNNNYPTSMTGNSQVVDLSSFGITNGVDYAFEQVSHIDVSRIDGTGNGGSSIGLILNNTADLSFENSDLELFGQILEGISEAGTTFSQFYGSTENSSTFAAAIHLDSNSYANVFVSGTLDGPVFNYFKPALQTDFPTTCHICSQTVWGYFGSTFQVNWKGRQVYNYTAGGLQSWSFNFFSVNPPSYNVWYQNGADTPILVTESFAFIPTTSNAIVYTSYTASASEESEACTLSSTSSTTLTCTFLVPTGAYWEYSNSTAGLSPSPGMQSAQPIG